MRHSTKVALAYLSVSLVWILLSDWLSSMLFPEHFLEIGLYKGWLFVAGTAVLLKMWLRADERRRDAVEAQLQHMAVHDPLTRLLNRAAFLSHLENAIQRARRANTRLGMVFLDLDDFKQVNDTLGHHAGDEVLIAVADRLRHSLRSADTAGRFGGDEFIVLLDPEVGHGSEMIDERLREAFREPVVVGGQCLHVTPSIGVAHFPDDATEAQPLVAAADAAMYRSKLAGRNAASLGHIHLVERG